MTALAEQLLDTFRHLPRDEQLAFVEAVQLEIVPGTQPSISEADMDEVRRRLDEHQRDPSSALSEEEFTHFLDSLE